jgi:CheY-like chemotaxis protein
MSDAEPTPDPSPAGRVPSDVLLVEDNYIIALDAEAMLRELGVASVRAAHGVQQALELIAHRTPEFALLDVNLGEDKCFEVAERLHALGVPFAFATGYGKNYASPAPFDRAPVVAKPFTVDALRSAILIV